MAEKGDKQPSVKNYSDNGEPIKPVRPPMPYSNFYRDAARKITKSHPRMSFTETKKLVDKFWNKLPPEHKLLYEKRYQEENKKYQVAMANYLAAKENQPTSASDETKQLEIKPKNLEKASSSNGAIGKPSPSNMPTTSGTRVFPTKLQETKLKNKAAVEALKKNGKCLRNGCDNLGVNNVEWDGEYCSQFCLVSHCRDTFKNWVQKNKTK